MTVNGRDEPYVEVKQTEDGIAVRIDFARLPAMWAEVLITKDELAALAVDAVLRAKS